MYPQSNQAAVQTLLNMRELDVVFQSDGGTSSRVVYVGDDVEAGEGQLIVFYLLEK